MAKKENKTNAMRILEKLKIPFEMRTYECDEFIDGMQTAELLDMPPEIMYKTLVTVGKSKANYVFVIPIAEEIDFKKAAKAVNEKSLEMLPLKDLTAVTGYIRGGCTAIGMKKKFKTVIDSSSNLLDTIIISGGKIGFQIELEPKDLLNIIDASIEKIIME